MKICIILGTRPEIIKLSPLIQLFKKDKMNFFIIHTNQHRIYSMERQFFKDFKIKPDYILSTKKDFLSESINQISKIYTKEKPDYIINQGDTYSVLASTIAFNNIKKNKCKLVHLEAGLRSYDRSMPEEINRIIADHVGDILLAPTKISKKNLMKENIKKSKIYVVGNTISDAIKINKTRINSKILEKYKLQKKRFYLLTLHRPDMVDNKKNIIKILNFFSSLLEKENIEMLFPIHPRTKNNLKNFSFKDLNKIKIINPCNYFDFLSLQKNAKLVFTDSGGIQEESCILKTPCITIRKNTERPETIKIGSNALVDYSITKLNKVIHKFLNKKLSWSNPYGKNVSKKIIKILKQDCSKNAK